MEEAWKQHMSDLLKVELERLTNGNATQKSRYKQAMRAVARVLQNPDNPDYQKSDLAGHCAVDVGEQYRIFFFIERKEHVVHFVWMNDENYIHTTRGFKDHCYEQFKKLLSDGEIEKYQHLEPEVPSYDKDGEFGVDDYIYFKMILGVGVAQSAANLFVDEDPNVEVHVRKNEYVYSIQYLDGKDSKLKSLILEWICKLADEESIHLSFYLPKSKIDFQIYKTILLGCGFDLIHTDKEEIFLRKFKILN